MYNVRNSATLTL